MTQLSPVSRTQPRLILGISLAVACCAGSNAQASCGDYLHTRFGANNGQSVSDSTGITRNGDRNEHSAPDVPPRTSTGAPGFPCDGPNCRRSNESQPPLAPAVPPVSPSHEALNFARAIGVEFSEGRHQRGHGDDVALAGYPARVEHPPRPARDTRRS